MLAVDGRGASVAYRKVWVDSTEARFTPGTAPGVLEIDGWRLGLAICKDTGIPRHWADTAALGIDAYVAGIVLGDDETWKIEDRACRIADDFTRVGCNGQLRWRDGWRLRDDGRLFRHLESDRDRGRASWKGGRGRRLRRAYLRLAPEV